MGRKPYCKEDETVIKKYANRRLYDTGRSSYVTLDDLCEMVKEEHNFVVQDAKTGEDLTRSVLTQIIVEQEAKGEQNLLPIGFLRKLIGFYGDQVGGVVPNYLEQTFDLFVKNQETMRDQLNKSIEEISGGMGIFPSVPGVPNIEELNRKNMEIFEKTMKMFTPFGGMYGADTDMSKVQKMKDIQSKIETLEKELKDLQK